MAIETLALAKKSLNHPDETRQLNGGRLDLITLQGTTIAKIELQPGWRWSQSVKPSSGTDSCMVAHQQYVISGRLMLLADDGSRLEIGPGDFVTCPPGHDAWVVGDEPFVAIDFGGMKDYARPPTPEPESEY